MWEGARVILAQGIGAGEGAPLAGFWFFNRSSSDLNIVSVSLRCIVPGRRSGGPCGLSIVRF